MKPVLMSVSSAAILCLTASAAHDQPEAPAHQTEIALRASSAHAISRHGGAGRLQTVGYDNCRLPSPAELEDTDAGALQMLVLFLDPDGDGMPLRGRVNSLCRLFASTRTSLIW
jgi:hypothetical protein